MKIKNNRKNFVVLQYKIGVRKESAKLKPSETINLPLVKDMSQILNKFLFNSGQLSVVADEVSKPEAAKPKAKAKKDSSSEKSEKKAKAKKETKKSIVDEAIKSTYDFIKSSKNKNKNEEK